MIRTSASLAVLAGLCVIVMQTAAGSAFAADNTRSKHAPRKPAAEKLGNFEIQDVRSAPQAPNGDKPAAYNDGGITHDDDWQERSKRPKHAAPKTAEDKLGNFEIQGVKSPRDAASGQATGIVSPRDPQSGLPTGK